MHWYGSHAIIHYFTTNEINNDTWYYGNHIKMKQARMAGNPHNQVGRPIKHVGGWNSMKMSPIRCLQNVIKGGVKTGLM